MRQRARQCVQVLHYLLLTQPLDFDRAIAHTGLLQRRHDVIEMAAVAHQYGDRSIRIRGTRRPRDLDHALRFVGALVEKMPLHGVARGRGVMRNRRRVRHRAGSFILFGGQHFRESRVHPIDDAGLGTEIGRQAQRDQRHAGEPCMPRLQEQPDFGLAKSIDRLHRIADRKYRAAVVARLPAGGEALEQFPLADRSVLEFVDEYVLDAHVERQQQIGRRLGVAQRAHRALRDFGEIGLPALAEHDGQFGHRARQQFQHRAQRFPLRLRVCRRRQCLQCNERKPQRLVAIERLCGLVALAPFAFLGQHFIREILGRRRMQFARARQ